MPSPCHCGCRYSKEQGGHTETPGKQTVLVLYCNCISGSRPGERVSQPDVQTVSSALPAHPSSSPSDDWGPSPHELLWPQEGLSTTSLLTYFYLLPLWHWTSLTTYCTATLSFNSFISCLPHLYSSGVGLSCCTSICTASHWLAAWRTSHPPFWSK